MSRTRALAALEAAGVPFTVYDYAHDPSSGLSYGQEAAAALGVPVETVFKTLLARVSGSSGQGLAVAVVPVAGSLDLKALAAALKRKKAALAEPAAAERATGYVVGGISPVGQRSALPTVVDASAAALEQMIVSAGQRGLSVGLAPADLVAVTGAMSAAVMRA